jgi:hypothetical protein
MNTSLPPDLPAWATPERLKYRLVLDEASPSNNALRAMHFRVYKSQRAKWRARVLTAIGQQPGSAIALSGLVVIRRSVGHLDWDNALGGLKPLLDCLVLPSERNPDGLGVIADDNPDNMPYAPVMIQEKAKRGAGSTEVLVFELPGNVPAKITKPRKPKAAPKTEPSQSPAPRAKTAAAGHLARRPTRNPRFLVATRRAR